MEVKKEIKKGNKDMKNPFDAETCKEFLELYPDASYPEMIIYGGIKLLNIINKMNKEKSFRMFKEKSQGIIHYVDSQGSIYGEIYKNNKETGVRTICGKVLQLKYEKYGPLAYEIIPNDKVEFICEACKIAKI